MTLDQSEKRIIEYEFRRQQQNKAKTAQSLGIAIRTLDNKLKEIGHVEQKNESVQVERRMDVEPAVTISKELGLPLRERKEVQKVPFERDPTSSSNYGKHFKKS
jgi:hypothetical protein